MSCPAEKSYREETPQEKYRRLCKSKLKNKGERAMNTINIKGRLVNDAEVKDTAKGKVVTFTLADEYRKNGEKIAVQYIDCAVRNKAAGEAAALKKGAFINGDGILKVVRTEKDGKYYTNTTVWINRLNPKPATKADAPSDTEA